MNQGKVRIKYLRDSGNAPIACIAYQAVGQEVFFGVSISNTKKYDGTVKKTIKEWSEGKLKIIRIDDVPRLGMKDYFVKREARRLAISRLNENFNRVPLLNVQNPILDVLRFLETEHEMLLGSERKIISSRVRSSARRARKAMVFLMQSRHGKVIFDLEKIKYTWRRVMLALRTNVFKYLSL